MFSHKYIYHFLYFPYIHVPGYIQPNIANTILFLVMGIQVCLRYVNRQLFRQVRSEHTVYIKILIYTEILLANLNNVI